VVQPFRQPDELYLLSLLEEAIDFAIYRVAVDPTSPYGGRIVMVSPSIKRIVGIQEPERFESWFEHLHPDDVLRVVEANRRSWQDHVVYDQTARFYNVVKGQWVWVHTISTPVINPRGELSHFTGVVIDITQAKQAELELQQHVAFENLILSLSTRFINLSPEEVDPAIDLALQAIGGFTGVDHAYLYAFLEGARNLTLTHAWHSDGASHLHSLFCRSPELAPDWLTGKLLAGEVVHLPRRKDLPPEAHAEKTTLSERHTRSWLALPMAYQGRVLGMLGFESIQEEKTWSDDTIGLLQVAGNIFVNALEHKRTRESLQRAHEELEQRVIERTRELAQANAALRSEVEQRRQVEESLRISQAHYAEVFDHSPLLIFVLEVLPDGRFRVLRTNPAHQRTYGLTASQLWGKTIEEFTGPEAAQAITRHYRDCIKAGKPVEYEEQSPAPYWDRERIRTFRTTLAPVFDSERKVIRLIGASEDITGQKQAEQILMERAREEAVAEERGRLARELHDAVTQTLFSTSLTCEVLPKIWERSPDEGRKKLEEIRDLTRGALAEMRTLLMELRPDALADAELKDLLRHLTNAFIARSRITTHLSIEGTPDLPLAVKTACYRIAQESLHNIAKHSEASQVKIQLSCQPGHTVLIIEDNGQGFDPDQAIKAGHYGLSIMRERADQIGADLRITSQPGAGTRIALTWNEHQPDSTALSQGVR